MKARADRERCIVARGDVFGDRLVGEPPLVAELGPEREHGDDEVSGVNAHGEIRSRSILVNQSPRTRVS